MKRAVLEFFFYLCDIFGLNYIFRKINGLKTRILMYHGVTSTRFPSGYWLLVHAADFEMQMRYLKRKYRVLSGRDFVDNPDMRSGAALITFDDGMLHVLEVALPILEKYELPSVNFVVPGLSDREIEIPSEEIFDTIMRTRAQKLDLRNFGLGSYDIPSNEDDRTELGIAVNRKLKTLPSGSTAPVAQYLRETIATEDRAATSPFRLMTKTQLIEFAEHPLVEVAGHTDNHVTLPSMSDDGQQEEIVNGLNHLEDWGINPLALFCFPSGQSNECSRRILAENGITCAVGTHDGLHPVDGDSLNMKRVSVGINTGIYEFKARLSGLYYAIFGETA